MAKTKGTGLMGFGKPDEGTEYKPNRTERRAAEQKRARQQRRGQRAYDRAQRNAGIPAGEDSTGAHLR
jgi:hypothetical protein